MFKQIMLRALGRFSAAQARAKDGDVRKPGFDAMPLFAVAVVCACVFGVPSPVYAHEDSATSVIASVNGTAITRGQLDEAVKASGLADTASLRKVITQQLVNDELVLQAAVSKQYADRMEVKAAVDRSRTQAMIALYLHDVVKPPSVSEQEVKNAYEVMISDLGSQKYKSSVIVVKDEQMANDVIAKLKEGEAFDALARRYSVAANGGSGGAMSWFSYKSPVRAGHAAGLPVPFATALAKLKPGQYTTQPIAIDGAFYIIRLDQAEPMETPSFDSVDKALRSQLEQAAVNAATASLVKELKDKANIKDSGV